MKKQILIRSAAVLAAALLTISAATAAPGGAAKPKTSPADISRFVFPTNTVIVKAEIVTGDTLTAGKNKIPLPEYCKVSGRINQRVGIGANGPAEYYIGFELRLPAEWNGRLFFEGGGGSDGVIKPPVGSRQTGAVPALARGFATVATDAGHQGGDCQFGYDQTARVDYFYNAVLETAVTAKSIIRDYYGTPVEYSYFVGGSNGGRQGLAFAQRFPDIFDGIVAGAPALNLTKAAIAEMWANQVFAKIAPVDAGGMPLIYKALDQKDLDAVAAAVKKAYDAKDGLEDGLVFDIEAERDFVLTAQATGLSEAKSAALRKHFEGPKNSKGERLYSNWPWDTGISDIGWRSWILGTEKALPRNVSLGSDSMARIFTTPAAPDYSSEKKLEWSMKYDFDLDPPRTVMTAALLDNANPRLTAFNKLGGKLILYHGMSDPVFSAYDTIAYYKRVMEENGGLAATRSFARLFLFPGMSHVSGGPATDQFDVLTAIMDWIEKGVAPDKIIATGTPGGPYEKISRPIFPYPAQTVYDGKGDPASASSFIAK
ncbi:MAG: tannase [Treponema sp. GWB1_62_6]|nr:MAG: tannase [Treponema sp. GWB1_62_6]OHE69307.1 MAG: tannase [Treponema sp. GWC1_61_84]HCM26280.1 tannase/feruloyl esterase family alpha/beta hydrolase [Treponema sp.]